MRQLLSKVWVRVGLVVMALPPAMAHATQQNPGDIFANRALAGSLDASANPADQEPLMSGSLRAMGM